MDDRLRERGQASVSVPIAMKGWRDYNGLRSGMLELRVLMAFPNEKQSDR